MPRKGEKKMHILYRSLRMVLEDLESSFTSVISARRNNNVEPNFFPIFVS